MYLSVTNVICNGLQLGEVWLVHAEVGTIRCQMFSIFLQIDIRVSVGAGIVYSVFVS